MSAKSRLSLFFSSSLVLAFVGFAIAEDKPAVQEPSDYQLMSTFVEAFEQVEANYVRDVDRRELMEAAIQGMLSHLDQYSSYIPPDAIPRFNQMMEQEFGGIGIQVNIRGEQLVVVSPLPATPAYAAGIRSGDVILEVDGEPTVGITLDAAIKRLQGPIGRPITLKISRAGDGQTEELTMVRQLIKAPTVRGDHYVDDACWDYMMPGSPQIGYLRVSHFSRFTADEVRAAVEDLVKRNVQGLVIDLRFNPGGLLEVAIEMSDMFLDQGKIVSVRGRNVPERSWQASPGTTFPKFPLAVLVNGYSASASEVFSACMQDNGRAVIVGERTWGKGSVQNVIRMENGGSALKLTTATYHRPSGINIHRFPDMKPEDQWGVSPDEGFDIPYSRQQWTAWDRDRMSRDELRRDSATSDSSTAKEAEADQPEPNKPNSDDATPFQDIQLLAAVNYIKARLDEQPVAEATPKTRPVSDTVVTPATSEKTTAQPEPAPVK
ncbi:MAG: S41 family peptidase [Planctomycetaceae bacterium]